MDNLLTWIDETYDDAVASVSETYDDAVTAYDDFDFRDGWDNRPNPLSPTGKGTADPLEWLTRSGGQVVNDVTRSALGVSPLSVLIIMFLVYLTFKKVT